MRQADIMCQIGQYSVLFLGASGDNYSEPAKKGDGLFYIAAYNENQSLIQKLISDPRIEKFGMPESYTIAFNEIDIGVAMPGGTNVHYTRAIHISEDRLGSRIYGTPRLQAPLNRLFDLEKVTGGGAEAAWLAVWGGMLFSTQEDIDIPSEDSEEGRYMAEQMQKYFHRMQRYAVIKGLDVNNLGTQTVDIEQIYNTLKTDFAGTVGIPQRILFGSERGELASTQDKEEWNGETDTRRTNFAEPEILDPFISWCVNMGVLSPPKSGEWKYEWYPVYPMSKMEMATYANSLATGASTITGGVPEEALDPNEWRTSAGLPAREQEELEDIEEKEEERRKEEELSKLFQPREGKDEDEPVSKKDVAAMLKQNMQEMQQLLAPIQNALRIEQTQQIQRNEEQRNMLQRFIDFILFQNRNDSPSPNINVNVENHPGEPPNVQITNRIPKIDPSPVNVSVQPTPIQNQIVTPDAPAPNVTVNVKPTPIRNLINVPTPKVEVKNEIENNIQNDVKLPRVTETAVVQRDSEGRAKKIKKTYEQDGD
jgi:uncharacterized protein